MNHDQLSEPPCDLDPQEVQQEMNQLKYERDEAIAEATVLYDEVQRLRAQVLRGHQVAATLVLSEGGRMTITRKLLEQAGSELVLKTWNDLAEDTIVLTVHQ